MISRKLKYAVRDQVEMQLDSLDQLLPPDHRVRELWAYVEQMDVSGLLANIVSFSGKAGAPAFDPRTLICLWLYATTDQVSSARKLARLCEEHLVYRWICGGEQINYHTLSSFRSDCGRTLEDLLVGTLAVLHDEGFLDLQQLSVSHDGMRVRASAGKGSMHRRGKVESSLEQAKIYYAQLQSAANEEDSETANKRKRSARVRAARERVERLEESLKTLETLENNQRPRSDREPREPRVSTTDPDAAMLRMANGGKDVSHNIQFTVENNTRVVTSVYIAEGSSDTGTLAPAMNEHQRLHGQLPNQVLADRGFFKYKDIAALERQGTEVYLPDLYPKAKRRYISKADRPYIEKWKQRIETPASKQFYKTRASTVEWVNACTRSQGLQQLVLRGRGKVWSIALWHALTHNIGRIFALRKEFEFQPG
jgi:transposase